MIGRSSPRSWAILAFSLESAMPAASTRMSAMLPGTRRSMTKISTDMPKSVRAISRKRRTRYEPISVSPQSSSPLLLLSPARGRGWERGLRTSIPPLLTSPPSGGEEHEGRGMREEPRSTPALPIQPDVFEAPAVVDAVGLQHEALHLRCPAGVGDIVAQDRPGDVVCE